MKKKHYPPSRIKYTQEHPTISIRVNRELYDQLKELREQSGKSLGDVLREALKVQVPSVKESYSRGYNKGFKNAEKQYQVNYKCSICGGNLTIATDEEKKAVADYMREHGWAHGECAKKRG